METNFRTVELSGQPPFVIGEQAEWEANGCWNVAASPEVLNRMYKPEVLKHWFLFGYWHGAQDIDGLNDNSQFMKMSTYEQPDFLSTRKALENINRFWNWCGEHLINEYCNMSTVDKAINRHWFAMGYTFGYNRWRKCDKLSVL